MYCRPLALTTAAVCLALLLVPRPSTACSVASQFGFSLPENGATYPANAVVFAHGGANDVTATIDGEPATAILVEELSGSTGHLSYAKAYRIDPQPLPGQTVRVVSTGYEGEEPEIVEYIAGPEDLSAPAPVTELTIDVHRFGETDSGGGSCYGPMDAQVWARYDLEAPAAEEAPVLAWVELLKPSSEMGTTFKRLVMTQGDGVRYGDLFADADLAGACIRVTAVDLANNSAEPVEVCGACRLREDVTGLGAESAPEEPEWTAMDYLADGPCGDMAVAPDEEGCGCTTGSDRFPPLLFAILLAPLALVKRRRRRRAY